MDYNRTPTKGTKMPQSVYSYLGSPLHLILEDEIAEGFNRFHDAFIQAQKTHFETHGRKWDPVTEPIFMVFTEEDQEAYDKVAQLINLLSEINGGGISISEEQITSDHLEKL
jgi:hypothetical protein